MIAKKIILLFSLLWLFYRIEAQQIFQKSYYVDTNSITQGTSFVKLINGDYLCAGRTGSSLAYDAFLMRIDSLGNIKWSKILSTQYQDWVLRISETIDSNYIIDGVHSNIPTALIYPYNSPFKIKIDENGNILWSKTYIDTSFYNEYWFNKTIDLSNSYYSVGGTIVNLNYGSSTLYPDSTQLGFFVKTDANGNIIWAKKFGSYKTEIKDFAITQDSGFILVGSHETYDTINGLQTSMVYFKTDINGNVLWSYKWSPLFAQAKTVLVDGNKFIIGGSMSGGGGGDGFILSSDLNGNIMWANRIGNGGTGYDEVISLVKLKTGNYSFPLGAIAIQTFDPITNILETHVNASNSFAYGSIYQLLPEKDFGVSAIGHTGSKLLIDKCDSGFNNCIKFTLPFPITPLTINVDTISIPAYIVQIILITDSFNAQPIASLDSVYCSTATLVNEKESTSIIVYPNPMDDYLNVELSQTLNSDCNINIYDVTGRGILCRRFPPSNKITLKTQNFAKGIYFIKVSSANSVFNKLFIKN